MNVTASGEVPEVGAPVKFASGGVRTVMYPVLVMTLEPAALVTVSVTV